MIRRLRLPSLAPFRLSDWLGTIARLVVGAVLFVSSLPKLAAPREFKQTVRAFDFSPDWLTKGVGYCLPTLELLLGIVLILGLVTQISAAVAAVLSVVLLIAALQAAVRGLHVSPGVFGVGGVTSSPSFALAILLALVLLILAVFVALWPDTRISLDEFLARNDYVEEPSAKRLRDPQGRRKYEQAVAEKQRAAQVRNRWLNISLLVVGLAILLAGMGVLRNNAELHDITGVTATNTDTGLVYGKKAAATVDIYTDFFSADSATFVSAVAPTLAKDVPANLVQVRYHLVASLDHSTNGSGYSTRAANAALCAADVSSATFVKYYDELFGKDKKGNVVRPSSQSGVTQNDFVQYGTDVGISSADATTFRDCVQGQNHKSLVQGMTEVASVRGIGLTPVVYVNGVKLTSLTPSALTDAIAAADAKGPSPDPSPSPSKSSTSSTGSTSASASTKATPSPSAS